MLLTNFSLDIFARDLMVENNSYPSLLNFEVRKTHFRNDPYIYSLQGFPKCISSSVNNVAAHGIPDSRALEEGDILNIDVTVYHKVCRNQFKKMNTFGVDIIFQHLTRVIMATCRTHSQLEKWTIMLTN